MNIVQEKAVEALWIDRPIFKTNVTRNFEFPTILIIIHYSSVFFFYRLQWSIFYCRNFNSAYSRKNWANDVYENYTFKKLGSW